MLTCGSRSRAAAHCSTLGHRPTVCTCKIGAGLYRRSDCLNRVWGHMTSRRALACAVWPFDQAWSPSVLAQSVAPQMFAFSLFPYIAFLYFLTRSGKAPPMALAGFYFLLVFVGATIPAGIYAKLHYGTSLANVDWLHGSAESLLTITNLLIVLGMRQGIKSYKSTEEHPPVLEAKPKEGAVSPAPEGEFAPVAENAREQ